MPAKELPNVFQVMSLVRADLAKEGIGKNQKNVQQGYKFRGIDDLYNAISPIMSRHGLIASPTVEERELTERTTKGGAFQAHVVLRVRIVFIVAENPESRHEIVVYGEGMDTGDKATNKALSSAFKYAVITEFTIPTVGDQDADASSPEESMPQAPVDMRTGEAPAPEFVTTKEALEIEMAVKRLKVDGPAFLKWCRVKDYPEIRRRQLPGIMAKLAEREKDETPPPEPAPEANLDDDIPF